MIHCIDASASIKEGPLGSNEANMDLCNLREGGQVKSSQTSAPLEEARMDLCKPREGAQVKGSQTSASMKEVLRSFRNITIRRNVPHTGDVISVMDFFRFL